MRKYNLTFVLMFTVLIVLQSCTIKADIESSTIIEVSSLWIELDGVSNSRQLIFNDNENSNTILRTGELFSLNETGKAVLVNEYLLTHIIDLRDEVEVEYYPDPVIEGVEYHHLNVWHRSVRLRNIDESTIDGVLDSDLYVQTYYTVFAFEPTAIEAYRDMFKILLQNESSGVLIHCTHGKDRTGVAITLILYALGVEWEVIEQEYLLSNIQFAGSVDISSLRYYRDIIVESYGSIDNYLDIEMDMNEENIIKLREKYAICNIEKNKNPT